MSSTVPAGVDPELYAQALAEVRALHHCGTRAPAYVQPADRAAEWARMAADLAAQGRSLPAIGDALCIPEDAVRALLGIPHLELVA